MVAAAPHFEIKVTSRYVDERVIDLLIELKGWRRERKAVRECHCELELPVLVQSASHEEDTVPNCFRQSGKHWGQPEKKRRSYCLMVVLLMSSSCGIK